MKRIKIINMNTKILLILFMSLILSTSGYAQTENKKDKKKTNTEVTTAPAPIADETPVVTEQCLVNISLFNESAKNKQYADAINPWRLAYKECPGAN